MALDACVSYLLIPTVGMGRNTVMTGNPQPQSAPDWATAKEVAQHLKVSLSWVHKATRARVLPHHRVGRSLRYRLSEVDQTILAGS